MYITQHHKAAWTGVDAGGKGLKARKQSSAVMKYLKIPQADCLFTLNVNSFKHPLMRYPSVIILAMQTQNTLTIPAKHVKPYPLKHEDIHVCLLHG